MKVLDALLALIGRTGQALGFDDLTVTAADLRRVLVLVVTCVMCAALSVDYARAPTDELRVGDVAPRTVKAPFGFAYTDQARYEAARAEAQASASPVFVHRAHLVDQAQSAVASAFRAGRSALPKPEVPAVEGEPAEPAAAAPTPAAAPGGSGGKGKHTRDAEEAFLDELGVQVPVNDVRALALAGFPTEAERLSIDLLERAMRDKLITLSRDALPQDRRPITVLHLRGTSRDQSTLADLEQIVLPDVARERVSLAVLQLAPERTPTTDASATIARALVRANLSFDPLQTEERREAAAAEVPLEVGRIKRGAILFRAGDTLTQGDIDLYRALQDQQSDHDVALELLAVSLFFLVLFVSLFQFANHFLDDFSTSVRDASAVAGMVVLTALLTRVVVASSEGVVALIEFDSAPSSVWYLVPFAGGVMLVRLLMGVGWTVIFAVAAASVSSLMMDHSALSMIYFLISGAAAAGAVEHTRERIAVLRAGLAVGVVNAATVLLIHFVQLYVVESELSMATSMRPVWSMTFAFLSGIASAFLVLGLTPLFELGGFVTDYRLMELANLNHPLLRQLMLRAPGSYHHSVVVGTLAEAGAEAIGANALVSKVASYFHDVGKSVKPEYFVENQRDGVSRHQGLDPYASAHIIISHVTDGARMAREHNLPQPILDNILMHHGTGILQYFYAAACADADDPASVDPDSFRYPGPKPSTREAGVIMLADKVEAATRTLANPNEANIRAMINRIVNSVIADGQFSECPLTFEEIHTITETFVGVLVGIYHQRIEYPQTADVSRGEASSGPAGGTPNQAVTITLDLDPAQRRSTADTPQDGQQRPPASQPPASTPVEEPVPETVEPSPPEAVPAGPAAEADDDAVDYEALDYLPRGD